ncbi:MAG: hypothetical protein AAF563_23865 [Pseudomonadota bacterium]
MDVPVTHAVSRSGPSISAAKLGVGLSIAFACVILGVSLGAAADTAVGKIVYAVAAIAIGAMAVIALAEKGAAIGTYFLPRAIAAHGRAQSETVLGVSIVALAGAGLFLELSIIRWHASLFPMFAFYKNFSLLACFAGLGLGYATSRLERGSLLLSLTVACVQVIVLIALRYGTADNMAVLMTSPIAEQTHMGAELNPSGDSSVAASAAALFVVYGLLATVFLTTVAMFIPIGQMTGRYMQQLPPLRAYGLNLAGSVLGVLMFTLVSYLWLPPVAWFALSFAVLLAFVTLDLGRRLIAVGGFAIIMVALVWPVEPLKQKVYSPYQLIEKAASWDSGLTRIAAAGTYFQKVFDFSFGSSERQNPDRHYDLLYYDLPYAIANSLDRVAIVGAGTGNDVAAALRAGAGVVDAVEIDPAIQAIGHYYHPEHPYSDSRVNAIVEDARTFFRTTDDTFDVITYAVLDSHGQLSQASSVRIDSFVYTQEAFEESYARLREGGVLYVSFALLSEGQGQRMYEMLRVASGSDPVTVHVGYDRATTEAFVVMKGGDPASLLERIAAAGFSVDSSRYATLDSAYDIPTDDWPFFYMDSRTYPISFLPVIALMLGLTLYAGRHVLFGAGLRPEAIGFFLLGAGFMLIEVKAITELGLVFGNTWFVVAIVIVSILTMSFLANLFVDLARLGRSRLLHVALLGATLIAYFTYGSPMLANWGLDRLVAIVLLTFPVFFSGLVFSTELRAAKIDVAHALGFNILGAMAGGLIEYNSMYFGFSFLFLIAAMAYVGTLFVFWRRA